MSESLGSFEEIEEFLRFFCSEYGYDFSGYTKSSLVRRLNFAVERMHLSSIKELKLNLLNSPEKVFELLQFLTINTTELFRGPTFFRHFRQQVVPVLKTYPFPNIWVAGCSTGEEIVSFAIVLEEEGLLERTKIYATDVSPLNLTRAKSGIFRLDAIKKGSQSYALSGGTLSLSEYYEVYQDSGMFHKSLFKNVTFADHCLATDSSFSEFHFISCRHVLIYFDSQLQLRTLKLFHDSLVDFGLLGLGEVEDLSLGLGQSYFEPWRFKGFYRKSIESERKVWL